MDPFLVGIVGLAVLAVFLLAGVHVGISLAVVGFLGLCFVLGFEPAIYMLVGGTFHKIASWALVPLPLFVLMGLLAAGGGVSKRLYDGLTLWLGKIRGGLGVATTVANAFFGTLSGSSVVNAVVFSKIAAPEMRRHGYDKKVAYGLCASAGIIGMLIPPSILMIVYGSVSGDSMGALLIAGTAPGIVLTITITGAIFLIVKIKPTWIRRTPVTEGVTWRQRFAVLPSFWPIGVIAAALFGGIFGGVFTPTEASAVAVFVVFIVLLILNHRTALGALKTSLLDTAGISAMIFLLFCGAAVFSRFMVVTGVSTWIAEIITSLDISNLFLVVLIALFYLALGTFLDGTSMILITVPIFVPVIRALGIDTIWFAMVVILAVHIGQITPPVGFTVYAAKGVAEPDVSLEDIFRGSSPFFLAGLVALAIIIAFPWLSTILPSLMLGQ